MMKDIDKIIRERHSVRKYADKEIEKEKVDILRDLIKKYNKEANLHIQLKTNDKDTFEKYKLHYGKIYNCQNYIALIGNKKDKNLIDKVGYYGQKLVLKAQEMELNTCWVGAGYSKNELNVEILPNEKIVCVIAIGYGVHNGKVRPSKTFEEVSTSKDVPKWYKKGIEYALLAPTAVNQQKFKFALLENNVVSLKAGIGPFSKVDLGIVKYHFELGADTKNFKWKE